VKLRGESLSACRDDSRIGMLSKGVTHSTLLLYCYFIPCILKIDDKVKTSVVSFTHVYTTPSQQQTTRFLQYVVNAGEPSHGGAENLVCT